MGVNLMSQKSKPGLAGWQKWALMTAIIGGLSAIVVFFNYRVFGVWDGLPYSAVVAFLTLLSFIITLHIKRNAVTTNFLRAAFVFEILLCLALGINAAYSLSVMRDMSVAGQSEDSQRAAIKEIGNLKGSRTQREALKLVETSNVKTRQQVFGDNERVLFWILISELGIGLLAFFTLLGLSVFDKDGDGVPDVFQSNDKPIGFTTPDSPRRPNLRPMTARHRDEKPRADFSKTPEKAKTHVSSQNKDTDGQQEKTQRDAGEGMKRLRDTLKDISFHHPGTSFKADIKPDCVWIRAMVSDHGIQRTESSAKAKLEILDDAMQMTAEDFRLRLEKFLKQKGFNL